MLPERLAELIKALGYKNISQFEIGVNVSKKTFYAVVNNGKDTGIKSLFAISQKHPDVNLHWLITGEGEMFLKSSSDSIAIKGDKNQIGNRNIINERQKERKKEGYNPIAEKYIKSLEEQIILLKEDLKNKQTLIDKFQSGEIKLG